MVLEGQQADDIVVEVIVVFTALAQQPFGKGMNVSERNDEITGSGITGSLLLGWEELDREFGKRHGSGVGEGSVG